MDWAADAAASATVPPRRARDTTALGAFQTVSAITLRREIDGEPSMALGSGVSVDFGIPLLVNPGAGLVALVALAR